MERGARGVGADGGRGRGRRRAENRDADALAAEHEPDDAEFPVLEAVDVGVGPGVEIQEGPGGDEVFATALAAREEKGDIGDLLGEDVDGAVNPDDLFVGAGEDGPGRVGLFGAEPGEGGRGEGRVVR